MIKAAHAARIRACGAWSYVKDGGTVNEEKCTQAAEAERSLSAAIDALAAVHHEAPEPNHLKAEGESILREALARLVALFSKADGHVHIEPIDDWIEFGRALAAARSALAGMKE